MLNFKITSFTKAQCHMILWLLPTIETCFNCFGIRSSDTKEIIKKTTKPTGKFKSYVTSLDPPPPLLGGEGRVDKNGTSA